MYSKIIIFFILLLYSTLVVSAVAPKQARCETAKKMAKAGWDEELATVGDCYMHGVYFKQDREQARFYYLQAMLSGSSYAQLQIGIDYLYFPQSESEAMLGYYLLDDLATGEESKSRPYGSYALAIFEKKNGDAASAKEYLELSKKDSLFDAAYALAYLEYEVNGESIVYENLIAESVKFQQKIKIPKLITFSCWLEFQHFRDRPFTMNKKALAKLKDSLGECN